MLTEKKKKRESAFFFQNTAQNWQKPRDGTDNSRISPQCQQRAFVRKKYILENISVRRRVHDPKFKRCRPEGTRCPYTVEAGAVNPNASQRPGSP